MRDAQKEELTGIIINGKLLPMARWKVPSDTRIFGSRFIDDLRIGERGLCRKIRLVSENYAYQDSMALSTKALTLPRSSKRILLSLAASLPGRTPLTQDITHADIQSTHALERKADIQAQAEKRLPDNTVLPVVKLLYRIPDSGLQMYHTYYDHRLNHLEISSTTTGTFVLFRNDC